MANENTEIMLDGIGMVYKDQGGNDVTALTNVTLDIKKGEFISLLGPSGCGKTTLLKQAKRELRPAGSREGQVLYQNTPVDMLDAEMAFTEIGYVQQNPEDQIVTDFVWHELAFGLENLALPTKVIRRRVAEMAAYFGMEPWFSKKTSELSGGQKRRVAIAGVLAMKPEVLILDEPTNHLDGEMVTWLEDFLRGFRGTVIMVTHDRYFLDRVANRILEISHGKLYS